MRPRRAGTAAINSLHRQRQNRIIRHLHDAARQRAQRNGQELAHLLRHHELASEEHHAPRGIEHWQDPR